MEPTPTRAEPRPTGAAPRGSGDGPSKSQSHDAPIRNAGAQCGNACASLGVIVFAPAGADYCRTKSRLPRGPVQLAKDGEGGEVRGEEDGKAAGGPCDMAGERGRGATLEREPRVMDPARRVGRHV